MKRSFCIALTVGAAIAASIHAQDALPKGEALLEKYIEVTGGRAAYEKLKTTVVTGTLEIPAQGLSGSMTVYQSAPGLMRVVMELPGAGKMEEGVTGDVAWSNSAIQGPRIKEGDEKKLALLSAAYHAELRWREFFSSMETVGLEDVNGQPCYKVIATPKDGAPQTRYYNKKTGLMDKTAMTMKTPMGEIPLETQVSDYRDEGGIIMPHKIAQSIMGQQISITFASVKQNVPIEKSQFDLPAEVKALLDKPKAAAPAK